MLSSKYFQLHKYTCFNAPYSPLILIGLGVKSHDHHGQKKQILIPVIMFIYLQHTYFIPACALVFSNYHTHLEVIYWVKVKVTK